MFQRSQFDLVKKAREKGKESFYENKEGKLIAKRFSY
jgi:hypothetical protein